LSQPSTIKSNRINLALKIISENYGGRPFKLDLNPFEQLVVTILSQNTSWRNVDRALNNLMRRGRLKPDDIITLGPQRLSQIIKPAGLHLLKSQRIHQIALTVKEKYGGSLRGLIERDVKGAREELMKLPGVGPKTADVFLAFTAGHPILPVDTHISRVSKRLHIAVEGAGYEEVKASLEAHVPPQDRVKMHIALIEFGRNICKAVKPRCEICPVRSLCPSKHLHLKQETSFTDPPPCS